MIAEMVLQISEMFKKGILKHYYFTHIDAHVAHIPTHSQKQPGSEALEWLSQMDFFFFYL